MHMPIKFLTLEQQNKGPVISSGWSYITPMTSHDVIGVIAGVRWISGVGWVMESWPVG